MGLLYWLITAALLVVPFWKLLPKFGIASQWALAAAVPLGAVVLLWVMAFKDDFG